MSKLIVSQDNDVIVLSDGTRIEVNTSMDGTPCGWIITEAAQQYVQRTGCALCGHPLYRILKKESYGYKVFQKTK